MRGMWRGKVWVDDRVYEAKLCGKVRQAITEGLKPISLSTTQKGWPKMVNVEASLETQL